MDSYLLFIAFLKSTELVRWSSAVQRTEHTDSIVSQNMERLVKMVYRINETKHPALALPSFSISKDTCHLGHIGTWLKIWETGYEDFLAGMKKQTAYSELVKKEMVLERLIKNPHMKPEKYGHILADWADRAGEFPTFPVTYESNTITCSEYWKLIIRKCYNTESIISIPAKDLQELITHCEENIEAGSIYSFQLFSTLREGQSRMQSFFGLGEYISLSSENPGFRILDSAASVEDANIQAMIASAPTEKPTRIQFPSELAFMKAKFKWETACRYSKEKEGKTK